MPRFSIFTPTHDPAFLTDAFRSLRAQTERDWEWVLAASCDVPAAIRADARVRALPVPAPAATTIGALKRFCCERATGAMFVELDHDDLLVPNTLRQVGERVDAGAGFVYSDFVEFQHDEAGHVRNTTYHEDFGWETYPFTLYGRTLRAVRAFPADARSLCEIYYAPNHVRAWTREAYWRAGGHDAGLPIADDHDLVCRTYLAGIPFAHTGQVGYLYRRHAANTSRLRNAAIQVQQQANRGKYLPLLIDEWCRRTGLAAAEPDAGLLTRVCYSPAASGTHGSIRTSREFLDNLPLGALPAFFRGCHRMLAPGGWLGYPCLRTGPLLRWRPGGFQHVDTAPVDDETAWVSLCARKGQRQPGLAG